MHLPLVLSRAKFTAELLRVCKYIEDHPVAPMAMTGFINLTEGKSVDVCGWRSRVFGRVMPKTVQVFQPQFARRARRGKIVSASELARTYVIVMT